MRQTQLSSFLASSSVSSASSSSPWFLSSFGDRVSSAKKTQTPSPPPTLPPSVRDLDEETYHYIEDWTVQIPRNGVDNPVGPSSDMHDYTHPIEDGYTRPLNTYETVIEYVEHGTRNKKHENMDRDDEYAGVVDEDC